MLKIQKIEAKSNNPNSLILGVELSNGVKTFEEIKVISSKSPNIPNTVNFINNIVSPILIGLKPFYHKELDRMIEDLDKIHNQNKHEINTGFLLSVLLCKCGAISNNTSLKKYIYSIYNPNTEQDQKKLSIAHVMVHSLSANTFQEIYIIPARFKSHHEERKLISVIADAIKQKALEYDPEAGDYSITPLNPVIKSNGDLLTIVEEAILTTNYKINSDVYTGINCSSADWYQHDGRYDLKDSVTHLSSEELIKYYVNLEKEYPQLIIESPFATTNWHEWQKLNHLIGDSALISIPVDMLYDANDIQRAVKQDAGSAITIDLKLVPTISALFQIAESVRTVDWKLIMQNDSGIEIDNFDIDCALGIGADFIKLNYSEQPNYIHKVNLIEKYNQESASGTNFI